MTESKNTNTSNGKALELPQDGTRTEAAAAHYIRHWRLFRKVMTHGALAALTKAADPKGVGISRRVILGLENGEYRYNEDHLKLIGRALGVAPADLIRTNPFDSGDIFAIYAGLTQQKKQELVRLARGLKQARRKTSKRATKRKPAKR